MVARKKKESGTSAYCEVPSSMKNGVASSTRPPSMADVRRGESERDENNSPTVLKVKTSPMTAGPIGSHGRDKLQKCAMAAGRSRG